MGDLTKNTLKDIWHSEYYQEIREQLKYDRTKIKMCEYCDNFGGFGTNESPDFVFKQNQFKKSWEYIENTYYKNE